MEASGQVKMESVVVAAHRGLKEGGRLVKRRSSRSEIEQSEKKSNSSFLAPGKIKFSAKEDGATVNGKRKRLNEEADLEMDSEHVMNAAQALFELFGGAGASSQKGDKSCDAISFKPATAGSGVKWAAKKCRTSRSGRKVDDCACKLSICSTTSATVTDIPEVLDSSASHNHHAVSSSLPEAVQLHDDSEADVDAKSTDMSPCGIGLDRGYRLLSQSSVESTLLDSRAESPSSPLHVLKHSDAAQIPKLGEELLLQFGFQNHPPFRPLTKSSLPRKPKAEEHPVGQLVEVKEVKIASKQLQRKKPRVSNLKGQPLLLQGDIDVPIATSEMVLKECTEENKFQVPVTLNLFERVKLEVEKVKVESREPNRTGSSTQGRLRSALSEVEKEARRLRRVQANRESARQTIRRKQVLCEELARKAGELQAEKDNLTLSIEVKSKELRDYQDINRQLREQILIQAEAPGASILRGSNNIAPSLLLPTASSAQGMQMMPYWWAFALAQSVAAISKSTSAAAPPRMGEAGTVAAALPPDFNTVIAATVAAFSREAGSDANVWMSMVGNMSTYRSFSPEMALPVAQKRPTEPACAAADERPSPPQFLVRTTSMPVSGHSDPTSSSMKGNPKGTIVKYQLTNGAQLVRSISHSYAAVTSTSTTLSLGLGSHSQQQQQMKKPANLRFFPTIGNGVQGYLGPRLGVYQTEAAALATEARRRRRELKRTKSLQSQLEQEKKLASVRTM